MTTPAQYLDTLRRTLNLTSDNQLCPYLQVNRQTISRYRHNITAFDDDVCHRAAAVLGIHPGIILLHMNAARTRCPKTKSLWLDISKGFFKVIPPELDRRRTPREKGSPCN